MCDTIFAGTSVTQDGAALFGKNSDRQRNEAHVLSWIAGARHGGDDSIACTYISVPQAKRTFDVLFCRPHWTWGPEMGANAAGVVIGNEAVHTRERAPEMPALIGMDLAGLALQRSESAAEAVEVIARLLATHGQGGDCGHLTPSHYNNSFIIADPNEAFVLETVERDWMVQRIQGVRTISNTYSIDIPDRVSAGLDAHIARAGGNEPGGNYAATLADPERQHLGYAKARQARSQALLERRMGAIDAEAMRAVLRDHGEALTSWRPAANQPRTLCMHAGDQQRGGQTTGAMVSALNRDMAVHWVTGTAATCLSIFKPVFIDTPCLHDGAIAGDHYDEAVGWWRHEAIHRRAVLGDFARHVREIGEERDAAERRFEARITEVLGAPKADRLAIVRACWTEAEAMERRWADMLRHSGGITADPDYAAAWEVMNRRARLPLAD